MKRKLLTLFIGLMLMFSISSCEVTSYATTQDDIYVEAQADVVQSNVDFNVVIRYGTPYYYNGSILYYLYKDLYYYPFYYDNYWYVRAYRRPFNHLYYRPYFRPHKYDYRFAPGTHRSFNVPNHNRYVRPYNSTSVRSNNNVRNRTTTVRPNNRTIQPRTNPSNNRRGNFGGRR